MNRRGFLKMLGLAPVAAPFVAAGIKADALFPAVRATSVAGVGSMMQFSVGYVSAESIVANYSSAVAQFTSAANPELPMGEVLNFIPRATAVAKPAPETPSVYDDAFWDARHTDTVEFAKQGGPIVDLPCDTEPKGAA